MFFFIHDFFYNFSNLDHKNHYLLQIYENFYQCYFIDGNKSYKLLRFYNYLNSVVSATAANKKRKCHLNIEYKFGNNTVLATP